MRKVSLTVVSLVALGLIILLMGCPVALASSPDQASMAISIPKGEEITVAFGVPGAPLNPPPPPPPTEEPTAEPPEPPPPEPLKWPKGPLEGDEGERGPSKPHCNAAINGFVTNLASGKGEPGMVVEIDASGWKDRTTTDSNGYYYFHGLCQGRAIVNLALEEGGLPTNPNAVAELTGYNEVRIDLGFFPPAPTLLIMEIGAVTETAMPLEPIATATVAPCERVTEPPTAGLAAVVQKATPGETVSTIERMPVTGYAVSSGYESILLPVSIALGALLLLGRRVRHYLIG